MDEYDDYLDEHEDFDMDDEENGYHDYAPRITFKQTAVSSNVNRFGLPSDFKGSVAVSNRNVSHGGQRSSPAPRKPRSAATITNGDVVLSIDDVKMAAMRNDVNVIKQALERGFPVDSPSPSGWTALMYAAHAASQNAVTCLLDAGAKPNYHKDLFTVLMAACSASASDEEAVLGCVEALVKGGADVNAYDRQHLRPVMYAAKEGRALVIRKLAELGSDLNRQDGRGYTALMWAVMRKRVQAVYALLDLGCHVHLRDRQGSTALDLAAMEGNTQIQALLSKQGVVDAADLQKIEQNAAAAKTDKATSSQEDTSMRFGDLELVLSGLGLSDLIATFHAHQVTFPQFLRMRDEDLKPIVNHAGIRKKILENIAKLHKKEWEVTSLSSTGTVQTSKLTCSEAIFIMQNLKKHTAYMASTVAYMRDHLLESVLSKAAEGAGAEQLQIHTTEAHTNTDILLRELRQLQDHVTDLSAKAPPPDLIGRDVTIKTPPTKSRVAIVTSFTAAAAIVIVLVVKRQSVSSFVTNIMQSVKDL